jgi:hypothetical protein
MDATTQSSQRVKCLVDREEGRKGTRRYDENPARQRR